MEDHEALETSAVVRKLADAVKHKVDNLLAHSVVTTSVVVGGILLARDHLLRVVQLTIRASADLVAHSGLKINKHSARNVLASTSLGEKGVERVVTAADGLVGRHLAIRLDSVLEAVKLPASLIRSIDFIFAFNICILLIVFLERCTYVAGLDSGLADVNRQDFSHCDLDSSWTSVKLVQLNCDIMRETERSRHAEEEGSDQVSKSNLSWIPCGTRN